LFTFTLVLGLLFIIQIKASVFPSREEGFSQLSQQTNGKRNNFVSVYI